MPRRRRWTPVRGTAIRIESAIERVLVAAADAPWPWRRRAPAPPIDPASVRDVLVLRLDRIGDVLMALPALADLRRSLPGARIRLAVGAWSEEVAGMAPVDEVIVWSAPWAGRRGEGAESLAALARKAREVAGRPPDVAIDLQGDVRAALLMRLTSARIRVGYANTGGGGWLTHVVPLDETVSWVEQNRRAVETVAGPRQDAVTTAHVAADPEWAQALLEREGLDGPRPLVAIHPSGGRTIKQWPVERWRELARRLQEERGATVVVTGGAGDRALARALGEGLPRPVIDLAGRLSVAETMAVIGGMDLFLSPDTGPMHMACAMGTPSVAVFGPSAAERYSSAALSPTPARHLVVRRELWCAPCNLIRRPPEECVADVTPECLRIVTVDDVYAAAAALLPAGPRPTGPRLQ
jgi:ADP-heptose:LPS heptosyltransferase